MKLEFTIEEANKILLNLPVEKKCAILRERLNLKLKEIDEDAQVVIIEKTPSSEKSCVKCSMQYNCSEFDEKGSCAKFYSDSKRDASYTNYIRHTFDERDEILADVTKWDLCKRDQFHKLADGDFSNLNMIDQFFAENNFDPKVFWNALA